MRAVTRPEGLRTIPLFSRMTDAQLDELAKVFEKTPLKDGEVLFEAGSAATHFHVLVKGEIALFEGDQARFRLSPPAPIGELGAVTGCPHNVRAVAVGKSEVWRVGVPKLLAFFEKNGQVAFPFYQSLIEIVSDKVRRDERRLEEMRGNIIRTQKMMKKLREVVLESAETPISEPIAKGLDELIENNRRGHYMVEPTRSIGSKVRLDDGKSIDVREISEDHVCIAGDVGKKGASWSGVLLLPTREIPISGTIEKSDKSKTVVKLDLLVDDYKAALADYLTRVQMLDFVV